MKNFPHQINQLPKLRRGLAVFSQLIDNLEDIGDDGVVGDALARSGVYTFRNPGTTDTEEILRREHVKPIASQGTRAAARDLRRFFSLLGFIHEDGEVWHVAANARSMLALDEQQQLEQIHDIWRQALLNLVLSDETGDSHPYQILLRLVVEKPGLHKPYAGLCLEAVSDSDTEYARIRRLANRGNPAETMDRLAGAHMAHNSVKILPSIAEQLGDIVERGGRLYISERIADAIEFAATSEGNRERIATLVRRPFAPRRRRPGGHRRRRGVAAPTLRVYDPDIIGNRINAHEDCLDQLSRLFPAGIEQFQTTYDLLVVGAEAVLLVECKTIRDDARVQVRAAIGQLYYYEYFDVSPLYAGKNIMRMLLTDAPIPPELSRFLTSHNIGHVSITATGRVDGTQLGLDEIRALGANW